jgi:hypothetical protein
MGMKRLVAVAGLVVSAVGLLWVSFGLLPSLLGGTDLNGLNSADRLAAISTIRGQIGTVLSAAFVAAGLYYTGRRFFLDRDKQFTDRFNAAVDHLGSDDHIVRAGGVRALDRILQDSPADRVRVLDTLADFIRHHSTDSLPIPPDVSAAIAAIRNQPAAGTPLDLHKARLASTNLRGATLRRADLAEATLTSANLQSADLRETNLRRAKLTKATLTAASLRDADLTDADLHEATLDADITGATLINTDLRGTDLRSTIGLTSQQIKRAKVDDLTQLPPEVDNPLHGPTVHRPAT